MNRLEIFAGAALLLFATSGLALAQNHSGLSLRVSGATPVDVGDPLAVSRTSTGTGGAVAAAAADARAGTLRAFSSGSGAAVPTANAGVNGTITISGPAASVPLTVSLDVAGSMGLTGVAQSGMFQQSVIADLWINNAVGNAKVNSHGIVNRQVTQAAGSVVTDQVFFTPLQSGPGLLAPGAALVTTNPSPSTPGFILAVQANVPVGAPIPVTATLNVQGGALPTTLHGVVDYGNTAHLSLTVPAGYTISSGDLLSQPGSPGVPLPGPGEMGVGGDAGTAVGGDAGQDGSVASGDDGGATVHPSSGGGCAAGGDAPPVGARGLLVGLVGLVALALSRSGSLRASSPWRVAIGGRLRPRNRRR